MKKRIIGLIVLVVFVLSMILTICFNAKYIFTTQDYFSQKQVNEMLDKEYKRAVEENADTNLVLKISKIQAENKTLLEQNEFLKSENETLKSQLASNEAIIKNLREIVTGLNSQVDEDKELIAQLNIQIGKLENENENLSNVIKQKEDLINENSKTILALQNSIVYYEEYINGLDNENEVFAIFVVNDEVWKIQKISKNGLVYLEEDPTIPEYATFNGWKVNGVSVDLSTYTLSCNTTFVADIDYTLSIEFLVDDEVYNSQEILNVDEFVLPDDPIKNGFKFLGWSINGEIINFDTYEFTKDVSFVALFEQKEFTFILSENAAYCSEYSINQLIESGEVAIEDIDIEITASYKTPLLGTYYGSGIASAAASTSCRISILTTSVPCDISYSAETGFYFEFSSGFSCRVNNVKHTFTFSAAQVTIIMP